ncbi:MAG: N-6 DNA Methylase [Firmicutes bacterium ADurb.Bin506]|nr:MAG: N-6 DNA Methylase [Firmicutes bacterium ADurb.Bin506]
MAHILAVYRAREAADKYAYLAELAEIAENDYNLNIPRYVDTFEEEAPVDLKAVQKRINAGSWASVSRRFSTAAWISLPSGRGRWSVFGPRDPHGFHTLPAEVFLDEAFPRALLVSSQPKFPPCSQVKFPPPAARREEECTKKMEGA